MSASDSESSNEGEQIRVSLRLAASVKDRTLEVPTEPIAVPADIGRKGLSAVVNHLLGRPIPGEDDDDSDNASNTSSESDKLPQLNLEFILGKSNKLLRKGVEKEARQNGLSLEEEIPIVYFPAVDVPNLSDEREELPDWISCLSHEHNKEVLFAGCYDGSLHLYQSSKGALKEISKTHVASGPIKCLATWQSDDDVMVASASMDQSLAIHSFSDGSLQHLGTCTNENQSSAISSLAFNNRIASGDGSGTICIWDLENLKESLPLDTKSKRMKTSGGHHSLKAFNAQVIMPKSHGQTVSGLSWGNHDLTSNSHLISGSWDHSIKLWDVEKQDCLLTLNGARIVTCLDTSYHSEGVVATGHPDCTVRLWDVRTNNESHTALIADNTFRPSHKSWVSGVQWSRSNAYHLASTSHDGTVKLWDIRSSSPLHSLRPFPKEEKGLCLEWEDSGDGHGTMYAGGTDCILKVITL